MSHYNSLKLIAVFKGVDPLTKTNNYDVYTITNGSTQPVNVGVLYGIPLDPLPSLPLNGTYNLILVSGSNAYNFVWNIQTDILNFKDNRAFYSSPCILTTDDADSSFYSYYATLTQAEINTDLIINISANNRL